MKKMSTGQDSTLENWIVMSTAFFGEDSKATIFLKEKAEKQGMDQEVIADEGQLVAALMEIHTQSQENITGPHQIAVWWGPAD